MENTQQTTNLCPVLGYFVTWQIVTQLALPAHSKNDLVFPSFVPNLWTEYWVVSLFYLENRDLSKFDFQNTCLLKCIMARTRKISEDLSCWCWLELIELFMLTWKCKKTTTLFLNTFDYIRHLRCFSNGHNW